MEKMTHEYQNVWYSCIKPKTKHLRWISQKFIVQMFHDEYKETRFFILFNYTELKSHLSSVIYTSGNKCFQSNL